MRLLLDTHALLWWLAGDPSLPESARDLIADETNAVHVSAASAWEIATKFRLASCPTLLWLRRTSRAASAHRASFPCP